MKKTFLPLILCLLVSFALLPVIKAGGRSASPAPAIAAATTDSAISEDNSALAVATRLYDQIGLGSLGLSRDAFQYAYKGFQAMVNQGLLQHDDILTVIDFSQSSSKKRMYIIDMKEEKVLMNTYVAHGKNSGLQYAEQFSNRNESLQSSLGFYITKGTYFGKHGLSLKLSGQEEGWNSNAEARAVVVHGAEYIGTNRADAAYMGRSWGCPAVPQSQVNTVINLIKNGTAMFIYHPTEKYIQSSKLLNS